MLRLIFTITLLILTLTACTRSAAAGQSDVTNDQLYTLAKGDSGSPNEVLILWGVDKQGGQSIALLDAATGRLQARLPYGILSEEHSLLYVANPSVDRTVTTVQLISLPDGDVLRSTDVEGLFYLAGQTSLSPDEQVLVLTQEHAQADSRGSTFALLETSLYSAPHTITLSGKFEVDALSANGDYLYLIEHLQPKGSGNYQVRVYNLNEGQLLPEVLRDGGDRVKRVVATMSGTSLQQITSPDDRWGYSLYLNREQGPFIHALNTADRYSYCIFLYDLDEGDLSQQLYWAIALSSDGQRLYAANGALGIVREYDFGDSANRTRTLSLTETVLDEVIRNGPTTQRAYEVISQGGVVLSPDDQFIYILGDMGIHMVETRTLKQLRYFPLDRKAHSMSISRDGGYLYVATSDGEGGILTLDVTTGKATVASDEAAVYPLAILGIL